MWHKRSLKQSNKPVLEPVWEFSGTVIIFSFRARHEWFQRNWDDYCLEKSNSRTTTFTVGLVVSRPLDTMINEPVTSWHSTDWFPLWRHHPHFFCFTVTHSDLWGETHQSSFPTSQTNTRRIYVCRLSFSLLLQCSSVLLLSPWSNISEECLAALAFRSLHLVIYSALILVWSKKVHRLYYFTSAKLHSPSVILFYKKKSKSGFLQPINKIYLIIKSFTNNVSTAATNAVFFLFHESSITQYPVTDSH